MEYELDQVVCNCCGKEIPKDCHGYFEDYIHIEKDWGYFSNKDGKHHSFDLCESCYDKILKNFCISPDK